MIVESFSDIVSKMHYHLKHKEDGYAFPLIPKYNKTVGNILPGQYTVISGLPASGKTSFVDQNYVLSLLLQRNMREEKPPLKIFYFSLKDSSLKKFQSLLCAYLKIVHNIRIDIPTLNSQPGRHFDINNEPAVLAAIDDAEVFFNELMLDGTLQVISTVNRPSFIYNTVVEYTDTIDPDDDEKPLVLVIIDSTEHLGVESDAYHLIQGSELDYKFDAYMRALVKERNVHGVVITPAHGANSRFPKENEPSYRQLGIYGKNCDKGIVLYNPIAEANTNYLRIVNDPDHYVSESSGINTLRFWHVVRNADGVDSVSERLLFLPGSSYMIELSSHETITGFLDVKNLLYNTGLDPFYKDPSDITPSTTSDDSEPEA
jgi:hypothetical protein